MRKIALIISCLAAVIAVTFSVSPRVFADPYPPILANGAEHFAPVAWPNEPADPAACGSSCGDWKPYTRFQATINDPRVSDPSNGGTRPQNYVNIASSCIDKNLPSIYYSLYKHPTDPTKDVIMFRWRVEQIANNYATGPSAGAYSASDPWSSALWTVLFDVGGTGFRELAAHLDGSSGAPATSIDRIFGIWGNIPTQSIDYTTDPNIHLIAHNPTAFVDPASSRILNFHSSLSPDTNWPNGSAETSWDYGTTRAKLVSTSSCNEYFVDYQIPVAMLDASGMGGPKITRNTPLAMLFCTANSLNNPFQKDCALNKAWVADPTQPAPFGDYISFSQTTPYPQPIVSSVTATAPTSCPGSYTISAKVQDTLAVVNNVAVQTVKTVDFYYYYDANGDGVANDGNSWVKITPTATLTAGTLNTWTATWDAHTLARGKYLIGVQAVDTQYQDVNSNGQYDAGTDISLLDDGMTPTEARNRTISYLTQTEVNGLQPWPANETWYANPDVTGAQTAMVGLALNTCGVAPTITKSASVSSVATGGTVDFTLTINNPLSSAITVSSITDVLPTGFLYKSNQGGTLSPTSSPAVNATGSVTWGFSSPVSVGAGASATLVFRTQASATAGNYNNSVSAVTSFGTITAAPVPIGVDVARMSLRKTPNSSAVNPDGTTPLLYTLQYSNDSTVSVTNASISDVLPAGVTYVGCTGGTSCGNGSGTVTWSLGTLAAGASGSVTMTVTVNTSYSTPSLVNSATVSATAPDSSQVTATASSTVSVNIPIPAFTLAKASSPATQVAPGGSVTWTVTYKNYGTASASGVTITDPLPAGFTYVSCTGGTSCSNSGGTVTWNVGTVTSGATGSVTFTATAANPFTANNPFINTASLTWTGNTGSVVTASSGLGVTGQSCQTYYLTNAATTSLGSTSVGATGTATVNASPGPAITGFGVGGTLSAASPYKLLATQTVPTSPVTLAGVTVAGGSTASATTVIGSFYLDPITSYDIPLGTGATFNGSVSYTKSGVTPLTFVVDIYDYDPDTGLAIQIGTTKYTDNGPGTPPFSLAAASPSGLLDKNDRLLAILSAVVAKNKSEVINLSVNNTASYLQLCAASPAILTLNKTVDKSQVTAGVATPITYTIKFANVGGTTTTTTQIVDTLPAGVTFTSATLNGATITPTQNGQQLTFTGIKSTTDATAGQVSGGATGTLVINATVGSSALGTLTNTAVISSDQTTPLTATVDTTAGRLTSGSPALAISLSADKTTANPGDTVTYTVTTLNIGTGTANSVVVSDVLPSAATYPYYTYGSCSGGCTNSSGTLSWNAGTLVPGASVSYTFTMVVGASGLPAGFTIIPDNSSAIATSVSTVTSNTVNVKLSGNPVLALTKSATPASGLKPGDTVTYTLTVSNTGSAAANGVTVSDPIPANLTFVAITQGTGAFDAVNNTVNFSVGTLAAAGGSVTLTFTATVNSLPNGSTSIPNTATAAALDAASRSASTSVTASASPVLNISKSGPTAAAYPATVLTSSPTGSTTFTVSDISQLSIGQLVKVGSQHVTITDLAGMTVTVSSAVTSTSGTPLQTPITYMLAYRNAGTAAATNVVVTDTIPAGLGYYASSPAAASAPSAGSSGAVSWNVGSLAVGASGTVQVTVFPTTSGSFVNSATIASTEVGCSGTCPSTVTTNVGGLSVTKSTSTPTSSAGSTASYSIIVSNSLASPVTAATVTDLLPSGFTYRTGTALVGGSAVEPTFSGSDSSHTQPVWSGLTVPAGGQLAITFQTDIASNAGTATYQNGVSVSAPAGVGVTTFDPLATTAEDVTVLGATNGIVDGYIYHRNDTNPDYNPGVDVPYANVKVTVEQNSGDCNVPTSTCYIAYTDSSGFYSRVVPAGDWIVTVIAGTGSLPASGQFLVVGQNPATVTVPGGGVVRNDNGYSSVTTADLSITKTDDLTSINAGASTTYTIVVSNAGPAAADNAVFTDPAVANLTVTGVTCGSASGGAACPTSGNTTVALMQGSGIVIPTLPSGGSVTFSVTGTAGVSGSIANVANISAPPGTTDNNLTNNSATDTTTITPIADVTTTVSAPASANAGSTVNVPVSFTNNGPSTAAGVTYSATIATGLSGVSCSGAATCSYTSGTGALSFSGLATSLTSGQTQNVTISYTAPVSGTVSVVTTIATTTSQGANAAPDSANGSTTITPIADVTTTVSAPASANAGSTVNVPVTFSNNGPSTAAGVTYTATISTGLSGVSCSGAATCSYTSGTGALTFSGLATSLTSGQTQNVTISYTAPASGTVSVATTIATTTSQGANAAPDSANGSTTITPVAVNDGVYGVPYDSVGYTAGGVSVLANDVGAGLTVAGVTGTGATCTSFACTVTTAHGSVTVASTGTFSYTPVSGYVGADSFTYYAKDGTGQNSNSATVSFNVLNPAPPVAVDDSGTTSVNTVLTQTTSILANDTGTGISLTSVTGSVGTCTAFPCSITTSHGSAVVQVGGTYVYTPATDYSGTDSFSYRITDSVSQTADATVTLTIRAADVTTTLDAPPEATPGSSVSILITFANVGDLTADGVTYRATLPSGLAGVACSGATCVYQGGTVTITGLPVSLSSGQSEHLVLRYTAPASGTVSVATAIATTTNQGVNSAPDSATGSTSIATGLTISDMTTMVTAPKLAVTGESVTVAVNYLNLGPATATGVTHTVTLPSNLAGVSCSATCSYDSGSGTITVTGLAGSLAAGQSQHLTVSYTMPATGPVEAISITGADNETNTGNNTASAITGVTTDIIPDLTTTVAAPALITAGSPVDVQVTFSNLGPVTVGNVGYQLLVPAGLTGVSCSVGCTYDNGLGGGAGLSGIASTGTVTVTGLPASLTTGQTVDMVLTYQAPNVGPVPVTSIISTPTTESNSNNNDAMAISDLSGLTIVTMTNGTNNDTPTGPKLVFGKPVSWSYLVTNIGDVTLTGVTVTDDHLGTVCTIGTMAPLSTSTCSANGIVQSGQYVTVGTATGTDPVNQTVTATNPDYYKGVAACDVDGNGAIDITDVTAIFSAIDLKVGAGDPRDLDGNGLISINDYRNCVLRCTKARCAP